MNEENTITDTSDLRRYRIEIPNLVDDMGLDVYAFRLYVHCKRVAGAGGGSCQQGTATLAKSCRMSAGRISKAKKTLLDAGLVTITEKPCNGGMLDEISIADIWLKNFETFAPRSSPRERRSSRGERGCSPRERGCSPRETKKELGTKNKRTKKELKSTAAPASDPNLQHPAVIAYRDIAKLTPNEVQRQMIADANLDIDLWKSKVTEWIGRGWNKGNVVGLLSFCGKVDIPRPVAGGAQPERSREEVTQGALELLRSGAV